MMVALASETGFHERPPQLSRIISRKTFASDSAIMALLIWPTRLSSALLSMATSSSSRASAFSRSPSFSRCKLSRVEISSEMAAGLAAAINLATPFRLAVAI